MDSMTILCWNARELNAGAWRDNLRTLVQEARPHIACIVESKLNVVTLLDISSLLGMNYVDYAYVPAAGTRGGIIVVARDPPSPSPSTRATMAGPCGGSRSSTVRRRRTRRGSSSRS
jgi:hypothetical protein